MRIRAKRETTAKILPKPSYWFSEPYKRAINKGDIFTTVVDTVVAGHVQIELEGVPYDVENKPFWVFLDHFEIINNVESKGVLSIAAEIVAKWEGFRAKPYLCPSLLPTIGYGSTFYPDTGKTVSLKDSPISEARAKELLILDLKERLSQITEICEDKGVIFDILTNNQKASLLSFTYNVGVYAFANSTLLVRLREWQEGRNTIEEVGYQMSRWCKDGRGNVLLGLQNRRKDEINLFNK